MHGIKKIPHFGLKRQYKLHAELLNATQEVLSSGQFLDGEQTKKFEDWLSDYTGANYAVTCHSATQALEIISYYCYNTRAVYDRMLIPNLTYPATLNAFYSTGWKIQLIDTDSNGLSTPDENIMNCVVGLYGAPIKSTPSSYLSIVDGAQHWLIANGQFGIGMAISFDPTKNLPSTGNGGAIVTNNTKLYDYAVQYKNNGKPNNYIPGTNSKMSELECAHLLVRARYIDEWQKRRGLIASYYIDQFKNLPIRCLTAAFKKHSHQKFVIYSVDKRDQLHNYLLDKNIEVRIHYKTVLSELPIAKKLSTLDFMSTSFMLSKGILSLPIYPELTDSEVEYITEKVKDFFNNQ
jgi:dTDP-4-amino-4,6-dideoxygalactose transaminase